MSLVLTLCGLTLLPTMEEKLSIADRLLPLIQAHKGVVAVGVKDLDSGEAWFHRADEIMPTASLIKVAVMLEAYHQADEGKLALTDPVTLRASDKVPGSGLLRLHFSDGARFPFRDAIRLMIAVSDNTATNLVLDRVGIRAVNERMASFGLKQTRINAKVYRGSTTSVDPARTAKYGLGSTTAREMIALFEKIQTNDGIRPVMKLAMLEHLRNNDDTTRFGRFLPAEVRLAHKDGAVTGIRTDAGILYTPSGAILLCVLTRDNADRRWVRDNAGNLLCARIAQAVCEHYRQQTLPRQQGTR